MVVFSPVSGSRHAFYLQSEFHCPLGQRVTDHVVDDIDSIANRAGLKALARQILDKVGNDVALLGRKSGPVDTSDFSGIFRDRIRGY